MAKASGSGWGSGSGGFDAWRKKQNSQARKRRSQYDSDFELPF